MFKHILVPVDGSDLSRVAVSHACAFARENGARLTFYHAKPSYMPYGMAAEGVFDYVGASEAFQAAMDTQAAAILDSAKQVANDAGVACTTLTTECDAPYEGIIATAESQACDLIFMASHGRHGARALLLGSETLKVLTHCKIPVLVYR